MTSPPVTNIARLGRATLTDSVDDGFQQIIYYQAGVGSSTEHSWLAKNYQGMTGVGLLQNVREAYGFLCNNYDYGDEIYITGFSRGAFTARSVAGMVDKVGILTKKGLEKFYEAFYYYENAPSDQNKKANGVENVVTETETKNPVSGAVSSSLTFCRLFADLQCNRARRYHLAPCTICTLTLWSSRIRCMYIKKMFPCQRFLSMLHLCITG